MTSTLQQWEQAEIERSGVEAAYTETSALRMDEKTRARYRNPPADTAFPLEYCFHLLGDVRGKTILEYGCGNGINTVVLAGRGARIHALDISPALLGIARRRLAANDIGDEVELVVGSAHDLPFPDESVDVIFGIAILHHLDLALSAREVKRVLRKGGRAIFQEPVRNSPVIKAARRMIPYRSPEVSPFERPLTDKELKNYADGFSSFRTKAFMLPTTNLINVLPHSLQRRADLRYQWDAELLKRFPALARYATVRVVEVVK